MKAAPRPAASSAAAPGQPTLLVLTLGARREARRRRLLPERERRAEIALRQACLDAALEAGSGAGCRTVVCSPRPPRTPLATAWQPQARGSFAERLGHALERAAAAAEGAPVVVVGSDVPGLSSCHVRAAVERATSDPRAVVLGPSPDGGFYLLATARPLARELLAVGFCRRDTLRALVARLSAAGRPVFLLEPLRDLDRPADLFRWLSSRPAAPDRLRGLVHWLVGRLARPLRPVQRAASPPRKQRVWVPPPGRAPPRLVAPPA